MVRFLVTAVLVLLVGVVVAAGVKYGWTAAHFWIGGPLALFAVVAATPTKKKAAVSSSAR